MNRSRQDYLAIISAYDRETHKWDTRAKRIVKRYRDERLDSETTGRRYNVLWSNVETLKPFLYSATPKPVVSNRGDMKDHIAREAAQVLEKALTYTIAEDHFGTTLRNARDDYLLAGRGTAWVRYVPEMQKAQPEAQVSENNTDDKPGSAPDSGIGDAEEIVTFETVVADYVHWRDFGHDLARTWEEVDCVWRKVAMTRQALIKRFPECGHEVPLDVKTGDREDRRDRDESSDKAMIYELWSKSEKRAVWLSKSYPKVLDELEDPLQLDHFFPCPRPIYATLTTDSLIPVPDYAEYQDQADELDELTRRIAAMTKAIKAVGVYDASVPALERILNDGHDNTLIPVENWAGLSEKGGLAGAMEMLPVKEVAETLLSLYEARKEVKADLYEITGMSDIIRGSTAPEETATAQRIKSNFASKRLDERQRQVERFARNLIDLIGNIIAVHFDPATLQAMTGCKLMSDQMKQIAQQVEQMKQQLAPGSDPSQPPPPPSPQMMQQMKAVSDQAQAMLTQAKMTMEDIPEAMKKPSWDDIIKLLRDHPRRRFSIDIETDSIVAPDDAEMQQERGQFLQSVTQFMQEAGQMIAAQPSVAPLMGQLLMFGVQGISIKRRRKPPSPNSRHLIPRWQRFKPRRKLIRQSSSRPTNWLTPSSSPTSSTHWHNPMPMRRWHSANRKPMRRSTLPTCSRRDRSKH
jgi:hypothetical protein